MCTAQPAKSNYREEKIMTLSDAWLIQRRIETLKRMLDWRVRRRDEQGINTSHIEGEIKALEWALEKIDACTCGTDGDESC